MIAKEELDRAFDARFAPEIKTKLRSARVAIAGLGGLGSNIAVMLARSGVGHLFLVDFDRVDTTNLNRQAYTIPHLGMNKTDAIKTILGDINPYLASGSPPKMSLHFSVITALFARRLTSPTKKPCLCASFLPKPVQPLFRATEWQASATAMRLKQKKSTADYMFAATFQRM